MNRIGYVLKVYPRFSETFVVTEILARESQGEDISIFALRPTTDSRFHPELARVKAPVRWVSRPKNATRFWDSLGSVLLDSEIAQNFVVILPELAKLPADEVAQGVQLAHDIKAQGITHLHAHFASLAGRMAWVASKLTGIPYTVTTHAKDIFHESVNFAWLQRICADAAQVIAISRYNQAYLEEKLAGTPANIVLQYNALEISRFPYQAPIAPSEIFKIAAVGRLVPKKGFDDLLTALSQLKDEGRRFHLNLAGSGELEEHLSNRIESLGLSEQVTMLGALTQEEVQELLKSSNAFIAPCVPADDGNIDGLPTVILEAMACGTPVISTAVTGIPEVIINQETGLLVEPHAPKQLAAAIADLIDQKVTSTSLAFQARAFIETHFDSLRQAATLQTLEAGNN